MALIQSAPVARAQTKDAFRTLASALAENRVILAYQPVISVRLGNVPAFTECLARVVSKDGTISSAGPLIAETEASDLGRVLDRTVLRKALTTLKACPERRLSINLSALGVGDQEWLALLQAANEETPGIAEWLVVEITETASLRLDATAVDFLFELRRMGVSLALDDFGSGHTSLRQLGKFRFDFLKIDKGLCSGLEGDEKGQRVLASVLRIARHFDMVTVAEGVETQVDADILIEAGVDCLQGYHLGEPQTSPKWLIAGTSSGQASGEPPHGVLDGEPDRRPAS